MDTVSSRRRVRKALVPGVVALLLGACGGGGGDGGGGPPGSIDVNAANQDVLVRVGVVAIQGDVVGGALGIAASPGGHAPLAVHLRKRIAAVGSPVVENCFVSGTTSSTLDDRDNSGSTTVGDVLTTTYFDCVEFAGEVMNGSFTATYTQINPATLTIAANVTTGGLSTVSSTRSVTAQGDFSMQLRFVSATSETLHIAVGQGLALAFSTPRFNDTITWRAGYTIDTTYDSSILPPGGTVAGLTTTTASGQVASASAGGYVTVRTLQPMLQYDVDANPRSGQFEAVGKTGSLQATVLSTTQVQIDLDADGNGVFDASKVVLWSDLF
jgi:hypothetical protein